MIGRSRSNYKELQLHVNEAGQKNSRIKLDSNAFFRKDSDVSSLRNDFLEALKKY